MQNLESKDKMLKIFSRVRCFSKDQLPRYVEGRLTHVEKHLLEQHLVNCELCSHAVDVLQKPRFESQYQAMGVKVQQYIRNSSFVAPVYEAERYQKKVQTQETFLTYFWSAVAIAILIGCVQGIMKQSGKESMRPMMVQTEKVPVGEVHTDVVSTPVQVVEETAAAPVMQENHTDEEVYKTAMTHYYKGDLDGAMPLFSELMGDTSNYGEMARYQMGMCYKFKKQKGKAREVFKELVEMNGRMKKRAMLALAKL